jgi:chromosomal replication initiator protein
MVTNRERTTGTGDTLRAEGAARVLSSRKILNLPGFVVVEENRSAARAVSDLVRRVVLARRVRVGPLVLHGLPGTGKTHLVTAALKAMAEESRTATGRVIAARELARPDELGEMGDGGGKGDRSGFADPDVTSCDLLIIEDVQHLPRASADALCRLIDDRAARELALIVTASAGPAGLTHLPRRLTSRLAGGLVVQLEPAGKASRRAIIEASAGRVRLAPDALDWLAARGGGLRTALGMMQALAQAGSRRAGPLDRKAIEEILGEGEGGQAAGRGGELPEIIKRVCAAFGVTRKELFGASRLRRVLVPRQVAMALAREVGGQSLPRIAAAFDRDHSTVLHACRKVEEMVEDDVALAATVRQLRKELRS